MKSSVTGNILGNSAIKTTFKLPLKLSVPVISLYIPHKCFIKSVEEFQQNSQVPKIIFMVRGHTGKNSFCLTREYFHKVNQKVRHSKERTGRYTRRWAWGFWLVKYNLVLLVYIFIFIYIYGVYIYILYQKNIHMTYLMSRRDRQLCSSHTTFGLTA